MNISNITTEPADLVAKPAPNTPYTRRRILHVEDDLPTAIDVKEALEKRKWRVDIAHHPDQAVEMLEDAANEGQSYSIIIIDRGLDIPETAKPSQWKRDWGQPKYAGDRLLTYVTENYPFLSPLVLTNYNDLEACQSLTRQGAYAYLRKRHRGAYPSPNEYLHQQCRVALRHQFQRFLRHRYLGLPSLDHLLDELFPYLRDALEDNGLDGGKLQLFYLAIDPEFGTFGLMAKSAKSNPHPLGRVTRNSNFVEGRDWLLAAATQPVTDLVNKNLLKSWITDHNQLRGESYSPNAAWQLLAPVRMIRYPEREKVETLGILGIEAASPQRALNDDDLEFVQNVTTLIGDFHAVPRYYRTHAPAEARNELDRMLNAVAALVVAPLHRGQGELDTLRELIPLANSMALDSGKSETLVRSETRDRTLVSSHLSPESHLRSARSAFAEAAHGLERIRQGLYDVNLRLETLDLRELVLEMLEDLKLHLKLAEVTVVPPDRGPPLPILLDKLLGKAMLAGLVRSIANESARIIRPGEQHLPYKLTVTLTADPEGRMARLTLSDNGRPWSVDMLRGLFGHTMDRFELNPEENTRPLALWVARWLLEDRDPNQRLGRVLLHNRDAQSSGSTIDLMFPLAMIK